MEIVGINVENIKQILELGIEKFLIVCYNKIINP